MTSIRRQLLFWLIGALLLTGVLASLITYVLAWDAFSRLRDYSLEQIAYSIVRHGVTSDEADDDDVVDRGQFVSQIWNADGSLAYSSLAGNGPPRMSPGMHTLEWNGEEWHLYALRDGGLTIQVGNPVTRRTQLFAGIIPWLLLPLSLLVLLLAGLIWIFVGRALMPMRQVRAEIASRDAESLRPLAIPGLPDELAPLVETLNGLLGRLETVLGAQGRFVADAAHELRTPLTAVRLEAQLALQSADAAQRDAALAQLIAGVERASHLVDQLLLMARLDPEAWSGRFEAVALDGLTRSIIAELSAQADQRGVDLGLAESDPLTVMGSAPALRAMLTNLIDNALRYIPNDGRVDVALRREGDEACLSVADNGPGIPVEERARVFDRFYRCPGTEATGSGLGLSIVSRVVAMHRGRVTLDDTPGGGLTVSIRLPLA